MVETSEKGKPSWVSRQEQGGHWDVPGGGMGRGAPTVQTTEPLPRPLVTEWECQSRAQHVCASPVGLTAPQLFSQPIGFLPALKSKKANNFKP